MRIVGKSCGTSDHLRGLIRCKFILHGCDDCVFDCVPGSHPCNDCYVVSTRSRYEKR